MIPDARLAIVTLGTVLVHASIALGLASLDSPDRAAEPPRLELVDVEVKPPPPVPAEPEPAPEPAAVKAPEPDKVVKDTRPARTAPRNPVPPPPDTPPAKAGGSGTPVYRMEGLAPGATGMPIENGPPVKGRTGRGGRGGGSASGSGSGSGSGTAAPVSVASIKTRAKAKGDFSYFDARKEYPEEARRLSIEGKIKVRLLVDAAGKVTSAKLLSKLGHGLDELAMKRARLIEFDPALDTDDRPVASVVIWTFTFEIPD